MKIPWYHPSQSLFNLRSPLSANSTSLPAPSLPSGLASYNIPINTPPAARTAAHSLAASTPGAAPAVVAEAAAALLALLALEAAALVALAMTKLTLDMSELTVELRPLVTPPAAAVVVPLLEEEIIEVVVEVPLLTVLVETDEEDGVTTTAMVVSVVVEVEGRMVEMGTTEVTQETMVVYRMD